MTFHSLEKQTLNLRSPAAISDMQRIVTFHEFVTRATVLTHGDQSSFNILLRRDKVVGNID